MKYDGFVGGAYQSQAVTFDSQRCVNLYAEADESNNGKDGSIGYLIGTPGLTLKLTLGNSPGRAGGLYTASNGRCFAVAGGSVYEIYTDWTSAEIGQLRTATSPVCMTDNGVQLVIVDGQDGWVFTFLTNTWQEITDPDMPRADRCAFLDQYVIFNDVGTSKFYWSDLLDATNIDSLDFASAEGSPDQLISLDVIHRQLALLGSNSVEVWVNAGASGFQRIDGVFVEHGCLAPQSVAKIDNTVFWLGSGGTGHGIVWRAEGYQPKRISNHALEYQLSLSDDLSGCTAWVYSESGHQFYVLNVPSLNSTWVYDVATSLWHERAAWGSDGYERHWANAHAFFNGVHVVNDYRNGNIYEMSATSYTDNGTVKRWLRSSPFLANGLNRVFHHRLQVDIRSGVGLQTGQGSSPQIMMRYTNDGQTWSNERLAGMGSVGQYLYRAIWSPLGQARSRAYEVSGSDPVPINILAAYVEVERGAH